jgi:iron complex outermembrane receptor protein
MAYSSSPGSGSGPNSSLAGSTSDNFEIGVKSFINETTRVNAAFFRVVTSNEIAIKTGGSYTVYQNIAADTSRNGFEASIDSQLPKNFNLYGAYTYMNAKFDGTFNTSSGFTNNPILPVSAGNKIPGIFKNQLYGELSWQYPSLGLRTAFETIVNSKQYANDFNTAYANGYAISNLKLNFDQKLGNWKLSEFGRIENIFDRNYVSTVRINDSNGEYYEAGAGRNYMAGVSATYQF